MRLSIIDYMEYLEGTNTSRCVYEGEEVLNSGHLILCGKLDFSSQVNNMFVCGLCLQTSDLKSHPHEIKGELEIINEKLKVKHMNCSCKAGKSGKCKHISALLIKCTRVDLETFEIISQTDLKCTWSKQKSMTEEKYQAVSIHKMPCLKDMTEDKEMQLVVDENKMYDFFVQQLPSSALAKHRLGRRPVTDNFTLLPNDFKVHNHYIQNILNNAVQSPLMMELHSLEVHFPSGCCEQLYVELFGSNEESLILSMQQSKSWHDQRKFRVTGSRVYGLYTYSGKDWEKKSIQYFYPKKFTNKFIKHGIKYEAEARDVFKEKSGFMVFECGLLISHFNPWLGYSPDGLIMEEDKPVALLEIKCLYNGNFCKAVYCQKLFSFCRYFSYNQRSYSEGNIFEKE